ncbi:uncharacterized protein [Coffea arabica]|uniref:DUF7804 domain-containing protein n=1 Tax=Coffea arabica TaxID=13443 RepID=A0A6P6UU74_COFAR|nr:uncharacterized protein LOC113714302 [Coffea arabica]
MASMPLRAKSVHNLEDLRSCCFGNTQSLMPNKGFVSFYSRSRNHQNQICQAPRLSISSAAASASASVVNDNTNDYSCSSSTHLSVFNPHSASIYNNACISSKNKKRVFDKEESDFSGNLDRWVKESVVEILNNLDEAPFLVHIYSDGEEASVSMSNTRLVKEKADAQSWPRIKGRWGGGSPSPSGIILVEEMSTEDALSSDGENLGSLGMDYDSRSSSTKVWGILIQGKGSTCPACYILKTCRVRSIAGFCTHFCLVRVKCFFESVDIQLKKLWLV